MPDAWTSDNMSPELLRVATRAMRDPDAQYHSLAHLIDVPALQRAYARQRARAAVGVDGMTKDDYGQNLQVNLADLHERLRSKRYRHQPIKRVHISKGDGRTRPLGISAFEDKIVQDALRELMEAVYEQDFLDCSHGFRPGRRAHDAIRAFHRAADAGAANWIVEADIASFFDQIPRKQLQELIAHRIPDGSIRRLVGTCLHVGVLDGVELTTPEAGTAQGSVLSPLLANVYLHYALDSWFERDVKPRMHGRATLIPFRRPAGPRQGGKGPGSFDFLGFTLFWRRSRRGSWVVGCKTRRARLTRAIKAAYDWCRRHRHAPVAEQHVGLCRKMRGHYQYFGVNGNTRCLSRLFHHTRRAWHKWLNRRSQRGNLPWKRFVDLLRDFPLPIPRVYVPIWGT